MIDERILYVAYSRQATIKRQAITVIVTMTVIEKPSVVFVSIILFKLMRSSGEIALLGVKFVFL